MKKLVLFIPVIVFILFYGFMLIASFGVVSPVVIGWLALFTIAGALLCKDIYWGAILGILPALHLIYMSTQETGQVGNIELPLGIVVLIFYLICGYFVYKRKISKQKQ